MKDFESHPDASANGFSALICSSPFATHILLLNCGALRKLLAASPLVDKLRAAPPSRPLSHKAVRAMLTKTRVPEAQHDGILRHIDGDGDGTLLVGEFLQWVETGRSRKGEV